MASLYPTIFGKPPNLNKIPCREKPSPFSGI